MYIKKILDTKFNLKFRVYDMTIQYLEKLPWNYGRTSEVERTESHTKLGVEIPREVSINLVRLQVIRHLKAWVGFFILFFIFFKFAAGFFFKSHYWQ